MGKHIVRKKDHFGDNVYYVYDNKLVEVTSSFIYEVSICKYWNRGFCQLDNSFYKSDKLLNIKNDIISTNYDNYRIDKIIVLVGVPQQFVDEYNLQPPKLKTIKKKSKK